MFLYFQRLLILLDLCVPFLCWTGVYNFEAVLLFSLCYSFLFFFFFFFWGGGG